jgi:DnaJ-class molecular chaperone
MHSRKTRCPDCASGAFRGNGNCAKCDGTGINTNVSSIQPECPYCKGSGICGECQGTGLIGSDPEDTPFILTLFGPK